MAKAKEYEGDVTLHLRAASHAKLEELIGVTGSENMAEMMNVAVDVLDWVVRNQRAGKSIYSMKDDVLDEQLRVELVGDASE